MSWPFTRIAIRLAETRGPTAPLPGRLTAIAALWARVVPTLSIRGRGDALAFTLVVLPSVGARIVLQGERVRGRGDRPGKSR